MSAGDMIGIGSFVITMIITLGTVVVTLLVALVSMAIPLGLIYLMFKAGAAQAELEKKLLATGTAAPATIIGVGQTGLSVNDQPQIEIALQVMPADGEPFTAKIRKIISILQIPQVQPGRVVEVRYDAADRSKIMLVGL